MSPKKLRGKKEEYLQRLMRCSWDRLSSRCFKDYLYLLNSSLERCNISIIQDRSPVNTRDAKWPNISVIPQKFCLIQCIRNRNWMHQLNSVTAWQVLIKPVKNQSCSSTVQIQAYSCRNWSCSSYLNSDRIAPSDKDLLQIGSTQITKF
jgi:hypothetical protein